MTFDGHQPFHVQQMDGLTKLVFGKVSMQTRMAKCLDGHSAARLSR